MKPWSKLANETSVNRTIKALEGNGVEVSIVDDESSALAKLESIIPKDSSVMVMSSVTIQKIGFADIIEAEKEYKSVKAELMKMDRETESLAMNRLGAAPEWAVGSVHAVTEDGHLMWASNTGSQLPAYAYGAAHVVWVVGTQKIVKDTQEGMKRIYEYCLPLESARAKKVYGRESAVNKILIINKELIPERLKLIFLRKKIGF